MSSRMMMIGICSVTAAIAFPFGTPAEGQTRRHPPRIGVTVALVDKLPAVAAPRDVALIVRGSTPARPEMILLPANSATGDALTAAVFALMLARQVERGAPTETVYIRVPSASVPAAWRRRQETARAARVVERLRNGTVVLLPQIGQARVYTLFIPRDRVVATLKH